MNHVQYQEEQRFTRLRWVWVAVALFLIALIAIFTFDEGARSNQLYISLGAALIPIGILFVARLQIRVDNEGFHYKFFPKMLGWKHISVQMIKSFEVHEKRTLYEKLACGYRRNALRKSIFMNITGSKFIYIKLIDGKRLKIGSENAETVEMELKRLTKSTEE